MEFDGAESREHFSRKLKDWNYGAMNIKQKLQIPIIDYQVHVFL
jgi:hypothetical protein